MNLIKKILPDVVCVLLFAVIASAYFYPAAFEGRSLSGHDNTGAAGLNVELNAYRESHGGETPRWINSVFSGMPTYQIAPSYDSQKPLSLLENAYHLWLPGYVWFVFASLLGFYILLRAFDFRQWMAALGAVVWAFSSYFFIIIAAGHLWKVMTLAYIPPTIAGMVFLFRRKYVAGLVLTSLMAALQIKANHVQMTYYFLIPEICMYGAFLVACVRRREMAHLGRATALLAVAAALGVALNASNLYHTYEYSKDTMRGKSELVKQGKDKANQTSSGLDRDYITAWSYGLGETWSLFIPNVKGGASVPLSMSERAMERANPQFAQSGIYNAFTQYFGEQPGTSGPVYVGAVVCLLFVLSLFVLSWQSPLKWALLVSTLLSVLLSWGHNFMWLTDVFIDHVPMYAKFRTVSSILVVAEFTIPLLAMLGLREFVAGCARAERRVAMLRYLTFSALVCIVVCVVAALLPQALGECLSSGDRAAMSQYVSQGYMDGPTSEAIMASISEMRAALVSGDAWRSLWLVLLGAALLYLYFRHTSPRRKGRAAQGSAGAERGAEASPAAAAALAAALLVVCLADMWTVNKRYLNDGMFAAQPVSPLPERTDTDDYILGRSGEGRDYRVLNFAVSTFNDNSTSFYYASVGGYHAAKLRRYQELVEEHIAPEMRNVYAALQQARLDTAAMVRSGDLRHPVYDFSRVNTDSLFPVINMLNTRWFILPAGNGGETLPVENTAAFGNAWTVGEVYVARDANEEIAALHSVNPRRVAVVQADFAQGLPRHFQPDSAASVRQTALASDSVSYEVRTSKPALVVFSEIYYPGWRATIDGEEAPILRADYVLRAIQVPAGSHRIKMTFRPTSVGTTETVAYAALAVLALVVAAAAILAFRRRGRTILTAQESAVSA